MNPAHLSSSPTAERACADEALAQLTQQLQLERAARTRAEEQLDLRNHELAEALRQRHDSEHRLRLALAGSRKGVWNWDADSDLVRIDSFEFDDKPLPMTCSSSGLAELVHADDVDALRMAWRLHMSGARPDLDMSFRLCLGEHVRWVRVRGSALERDGKGLARRMTGTIKDVTSQRHAEQSLRLMAHAFSSTRDALVVTDHDWRIVEANEAYCRLAGAAPNAVQGTVLTERLNLPALAPLPIGDEAAWAEVTEMRRLDGLRVPVDVTITTLPGDHSGGTYLVSLNDISEQRRVEARLEHLALSDAVTGLPNRSALENQLLRQLDREQAFALMYLDIEGVKEVNDSFGHDAGDDLLRQLADRLRTILPAGTFISRWGGDEFVLVLAPGSGETEVRSCAQTMIAALSPPMKVFLNEISVAPSIGAVLVPRDGRESGLLLRKADSAMQAAKLRGRDSLAFYDGSLDTDSQRRVRMHNQLRLDAERNGFTFVAQPKVDREGHAVGAELLMRWPTAAFGMVSPGEFIPMAEKVGLIGLMGRHALHAAAQLAARSLQVHQPLPVAVNLSPKQLLQRGLDRQLLLACERAGVAPAMLELELTESALVDNMTIIEPLLQRLRQHGFSLALDDFGTGFSSLSYLRHLPFNKIKIDRSFVMDIDHDHRAARLLAHMVKLCGALGMSTVAEGVESESQFKALLDLGVQEFQGYYFARPLPVDEWVARLSARPGEPPHLPT